MCLLLTNKKRKQTAKEDIVCYKGLITSYEFISFPVHGIEFHGIIKGIACKGKISIEGERIFFCTNSYELNGAHCADTFEYDYSFTMESRVTSVIINGREQIEKFLLTPYKEARITIGETYSSVLKKDEDAIYQALHSFANLADTREEIEEGIYVKCIIPKGAKYYEGEFDGCPSYASDKLTYVEIVD
jgi:hypothetical protein